MMLQTQKLPGLKDFGGKKKFGLKLQINLSSGDEKSERGGNDRPNFGEGDKLSLSEQNESDRQLQREPSLE